MICHKSDSGSITKTAEALKNGDVVIIPTDTVYGFSSIVSDEIKTASKIMEIKGRDENKPFIQLIPAPETIKNYSDDIIPEEILKYWPGPLTVIVKDKRLKGCKIDTTAFRCPGDTWLRQLIKTCGYPLYSTSVNRSGKPVLDSETEIINEFENETSLIVLDGDKKNALPSTIIKIEEGKIEVLRQGSLKIDL